MANPAAKAQSYAAQRLPAEGHLVSGGVEVKGAEIVGWVAVGLLDPVPLADHIVDRDDSRLPGRIPLFPCAGRASSS